MGNVEKLRMLFILITTIVEVVCRGFDGIWHVDRATFYGDEKGGETTSDCDELLAPNLSGGWCNPPQRHSNLSLPMCLKIALYMAGIAPVRYRHIPCTKQGRVKFEIKGNPYWRLVLTYNVGGAGDIKDRKIKGSNTGWLQMERKWGQNWQIGVVLTGQSLSFLVTTSEEAIIQFDNAALAGWQFNQTYDRGKSF